ncbi:MAG: MCD, Malonyl-CoA decarboxylase MCD [Stappia sp.]|uniref:malonyl-CoA decarboxylase n=1 Tax=Stappia sp. TaxID=1870903 RepID=UPI000C3EE700|nr:malonyl-CoA decarboxylase [Stappia sp.]MBM21476.1 MCD, Malonyl-CoA decarboxylase MCD [Stappia sp.]
MNSTSFFNDLLSSIAEQGRQLLDLRRERSPSGRGLGDLCEALLSGRGEASGVALARDILTSYAALDATERKSFFLELHARFGADGERMSAAAREVLEAPGDPARLRVLHAASEPRRQELIRRLNLAPGGTTALVKMRKDLLGLLREAPELKDIDVDFEHLFSSWFNRGFLVMQRIDWSTPAAVLERIIRYEAVHEIHGWEDLRRRIALPDRRLYAFFHPALVDDPLIFVEVALLRAIPDAIPPILAEDRDEVPAGEATTAVFYSISNCQEGLRGISFGNFLIKQVVEELRRDLPGLKTFVTLSPVPGFRAWLTRSAEAGEGSVVKSLPAEFRASLAASDTTDAVNAVLDDAEQAEALREPLRALCAHYLVREKSRGTRPLDPVARFHLGNGARLERVHWNADPSANGRRQSFGLMVNYLYDLGEIEKNHEAFAATGLVAASSSVSRLLKAVPEQKKQTPDPVE